jgi:signal transduction histidine kinase
MIMKTNVDEQASSIWEITAIIHDLRNPLSAIRASAEMLIGPRLSDSQLRRVARNLYGASVRTEELLEEFLRRYRGTKTGVEPSDLHELVNSAVEKVALLAESQSVRIMENVPERLIIELDRRRIERVLVNLFVNALEVMPGGGTILVSAIRQDHSALIKVRDTGPGIAPEIRPRLFEPFATARKVNGLGLGLACSRQAVTDQGGQMWVEASQQGACFAFSLPVRKAMPSQTEPHFPRSAEQGAQSAAIS